tara:strand:+ start:234 stop:506 length:273 start_codon:yes stop_codon:yes gene_type:complete
MIPNNWPHKDEWEKENVMTRTEMIDNLLDSYTTREIRALAKRLGVDVNDDAWKYWSIGKVYLTDAIHDKLFDPGGSYHEFNKLAEANDDK